MADLLINYWWGWIWDDSFLNRNGECLDMSWIDIRTSPRYITVAWQDQWQYAETCLAYSGTLNYTTETVDWLVQSYDSHCAIDTTNIDALVAWADVHISVGSNLNDYNSTTNREGIRHFFFTYNNSTNPIKVVDYSWWVRALKTSINTSWWASPADIVNARTSAACYLWEWAILFSRENKIYEFNPSTETVSTWWSAPNNWAKIVLEIGAVVKNIYYHNWNILVIYTVNNDTKILAVSYNWTTYTNSNYVDVTKWEKCLCSAFDKWNLYWVSTSGIFVYNWSSQLVKAKTFTTSAVCSYNKWILRIWDGTSFYEYGINKPWYWSPLTKFTAENSIKWVTENAIIVSYSSTFKRDNLGAYKTWNTYTLHPYVAWEYGFKKTWLWIRIWHIFNPLSSYTDSSIKENVVVSIQTDDMEIAETFVTIATITDLTSTYTDILPTTIAKALETAWYSNNFWYFRLKLTLNCWDPYAWYWNLIFRKRPKVFDVHIYHDEILNSF